MAGTLEYELLNKNLEMVDGHAVKAPEDYQNPEQLYEALIARVRKYHPSADISLIEKAYKLSREAHKEQVRKSGEPYIIHPLWVGIILADLEMDKETIVAGMLHDTVEDTEMTVEDITREFGEEVALLVDGVTKLGQLSYSKDKLEVQAENLRKMFLAMAKDIRVIIIKLADRLHNMRTLEFMVPAKQKEKARETMDIYAPIAQRLGISKIKTELDDLSLKYYQPEVYFQLVKDLNERKTEREEFVQQIVAEVSHHMENAHIQAKVYGRVKHFFSIYKKMVNQNKTLDQVYDLFAVRIIVDSVKDCYAALGVIHEMYTPIPGRFKDYIAMPKANMYQSLHTTLMGPAGQPFEIQIRTEEMHKTAEYGIAAHWKYKESGGSAKNNKSREEEKLSWLRQILEWQRDMSDNREFLSLLKGDLDLFAEDVYCFTPNGDVKNLPNGSTPVDFAYAIHSAVGNKMVGARVNGKLVNIDYKIQNGDRIEILTSQNSKGPSRDWLTLVKTSKARNKIRQFFKNQDKELSINRGRDLLMAQFHEHDLVANKFMDKKHMDKVLQKSSYKTEEALFAAIGFGEIGAITIFNRLTEDERREEERAKARAEAEELVKGGEVKVENKKDTLKVRHEGGVVIQGASGLLIRIAKCCNPVPGDEIVGYITKGRGVAIHRQDCMNLRAQDNYEQRLIDVEWEDNNTTKDYIAHIDIYGLNRAGLLNDVLQVLSNTAKMVSTVNAQPTKDMKFANIHISFGIPNLSMLTTVVDKIKSVPEVYSVKRTNG